VSFAKTAEPIEMPFGLRTWVDQRNHVLDGGPDPPMGKGQFLGEGAHCKVQGHSAVSCTKAMEPIEMPLGLWARIGPRKHVLGGVYTGATWRYH